MARLVLRSKIEEGRWDPRVKSGEVVEAGDAPLGIVGVNHPRPIAFNLETLLGADFAGETFAYKRGVVTYVTPEGYCHRGEALIIIETDEP